MVPLRVRAREAAQSEENSRLSQLPWETCSTRTTWPTARKWLITDWWEPEGNPNTVTQPEEAVLVLLVADGVFTGGVFSAVMSTSYMEEHGGASVCG